MSSQRFDEFVVNMELPRTEQFDLTGLIKIIAGCHAGRCLLDQEFKVQYDAQSYEPVVYHKEKLITLPTGRHYEQLLFMLCSSLRRLQQGPIDPMAYEPDDAILVNRLIIFDSYVRAIHVAYELMRTNQLSSWKWLCVQQQLASTTRIFEMNASDDFRKLNNGAVHKASLDNLFRNTVLIDKRAIHLMLLDKYMSQPKTKPDFNKLLAIGQLPSGANYLPNVLNNTSTYSTIDDRPNANFLWFIKFERGFLKKAVEIEKEMRPIQCRILPFRKAN